MKSRIRGPLRGLFSFLLSYLVSYLGIVLGAAAGLQLLCSCSGCSLNLFQEPSPRDVCILSYNVQNLFDDVHDGTEYYDYDPSGDEWNSELFHLKMLQLSDVLSRHPEGGADIVLLQEIENGNALHTLLTYYLKGCGYRHSCITADGGCAVNTALLSRYPIEEVRAHTVSIDGNSAGRPILECCILVGEQRLRLFNCHWKSKSGGAAETEPLRRAAAGVLAARMQQITALNPDAAIVVAGDLNECVDEWGRIEGTYLTALLPRAVYAGLPPAERRFSIGISEDASAAQLSGELVVLVSPWLSSARNGQRQISGSYAFRGEWETIDHFLLSAALFDGRGVEFEEFRVIRDEALLNEDGYPLRWISDLGTGYSDHLPIMLQCRVE